MSVNIYPFCKCRNWDLDTSNDLPAITKLRGGVKVWLRVIKKISTVYHMYSSVLTHVFPLNSTLRHRIKHMYFIQSENSGKVG